MDLIIFSTGFERDFLTGACLRDLVEQGLHDGCWLLHARVVAILGFPNFIFLLRGSACDGRFLNPVS